MPSKYARWTKLDLIKRIRTLEMSVAIQDETIRNLRSCIDESKVEKILKEKKP